MRLLIVLLVFITPSLFAEESALPVETASIRSVTAEQIFNGTIEAVHQSTVSAQTSGRIIELPFDVNDFVEKGDVIVRFRDTEQRAQADAAAGNLKEIEARFTEAQAEFKRVEDVHKRGLLAVAALDRARANLNAVKAKREAVQANLKRAQEALEQTVIRAPYSGIVVERHVEMGELATVGKPLMTGLSLEHLRAIVDIPQTFIDQVRQQQTAALILPNGQRIIANKLSIYPKADASTHTFRVRVQLPEGQHGVYPGMLTKVAFSVGEEQQLSVAAKAIVRRSEVTAVYIQDSAGGITLRPIRAGRITADNRVPILAGLEVGELVITDPIAAGIQLKQKAVTDE